MRRTLKEHVLEQVSESGAAGLLVGGSDMVPEVDCHDRGCVIFGERDKQPVIELKAFYWNLHCRKLPAMQTHWNPLGTLS